MIEGFVNANYEAVLTLALRGSAGQVRMVEAVVDTGFNGFLTLPPAVVTALGFPFQTWTHATLANGSEESFDVYNATVLWDGQPRHVPAAEADATPLIGMALMDEHSLFVEITDGGRVVIQPAEGT